MIVCACVGRGRWVADKSPLSRRRRWMPGTRAGLKSCRVPKVSLAAHARGEIAGGREKGAGRQGDNVCNVCTKGVLPLTDARERAPSAGRPVAPTNPDVDTHDLSLKQGRQSPSPQSDTHTNTNTYALSYTHTHMRIHTHTHTHGLQGRQPPSPRRPDKRTGGGASRPWATRTRRRSRRWRACQQPTWGANWRSWVMRCERLVRWGRWQGRWGS